MAAAGAAVRQRAAADKLQLNSRPAISKAAAQPKATAPKRVKAAVTGAPAPGGAVPKRPKAAPSKAVAEGPAAGGDTGISSLLELAGTAPAALCQQPDAAAGGSALLGQTSLAFRPGPAAQTAASAEAAAAATKKQRTKASDLNVAAVEAKVAAKHASCSLKDLSMPEMQCYLRWGGRPTKVPCTRGVCGIISGDHRRQVPVRGDTLWYSAHILWACSTRGARDPPLCIPL